MAYDQEVGHENFKNGVQLLEITRHNYHQASMRSEKEISDAREMAKLWLWRGRISLIQKNPSQYPPPPPGKSFKQLINEAATEAEKEGLFKAIDHDFPAFGKAYSQLTEDELMICIKIAYERLRALNWLCGLGKDWDKVSTNT